MTEIPKFYYVIPTIGIAIVLALLFMPTQADDVYFLNQGGGSSSGVTTLTSNNSAIALNTSSGNILISPKWELLCEITQVNTSNQFSCGDFTPRNNLYVTAGILTNVDTLTVGLRFNNDANTNYSWRRSANGGADTTATSDTDCFLISLSPNGGGYIAFEILNFEEHRKVLVMQEASDLSSSAGFAPAKVEETCKWDNTTDQITEVRFISNGITNDYIAGSKITIWGYD